VRRVLAVADSDSYLKWAACLLDELPAGWDRRLVLVRSPIVPSPDQIRSALHGTRAEVPQVLAAHAVGRLVRDYRPDAVLLACTGPAVDVLAPLTVAAHRPVLVSGLPGISVPASARAWHFRAGIDLLVVHSRREAAEFATLARAAGLPGRVGFTRLPFLQPVPPAAIRDRVIFATQAKFPTTREDRARILRTLATLAADRPDLKVIVKTRTRSGEQQTHREQHDYESLWYALPGVDRDLLTFESGPMREQLAQAAGFVTVSSTAALEAIAADVPVLILADFGVTPKLVNEVFTGSGLLGTLDDLAKAEFRTPDPDWCAVNYFHDPADSTWLELLEELLDRDGTLPPPLRAPAKRRLTRPRARLRLEAPPALARGLIGLRAAVRGR
jgi:putative glycosyltransferase DUF6716